MIFLQNVVKFQHLHVKKWHNNNPSMIDGALWFRWSKSEATAMFQLHVPPWQIIRHKYYITFPELTEMLDFPRLNTPYHNLDVCQETLNCLSALPPPAFWIIITCLLNAKQFGLVIVASSIMLVPEVASWKMKRWPNRELKNTDTSYNLWKKLKFIVSMESLVGLKTFEHGADVPRLALTTALTSLRLENDACSVPKVTCKQQNVFNEHLRWKGHDQHNA